MKTEIYSKLEQKLFSQKKTQLEQKQLRWSFVIWLLIEFLVLGLSQIYPELKQASPVPHFSYLVLLIVIPVVVLIVTAISLPLGKVPTPTEEEVKAFAREELKEMEETKYYVLLFILLCEDEAKAKKAQENWDLAVEEVKKLVEG